MISCVLGRVLVLINVVSTAIFYMHRGFFARALEDSPTVDPLNNRYSQSVLAASMSACSYITLIESLFAQHPRLSERMWFLFTHVFSCAVRQAQFASIPDSLHRIRSFLGRSLSSAQGTPSRAMHLCISTRLSRCTSKYKPRMLARCFPYCASYVGALQPRWTMRPTLHPGAHPRPKKSSSARMTNSQRSVARRDWCRRERVAVITRTRLRLLLRLRQRLKRRLLSVRPWHRSRRLYPIKNRSTRPVQ